MFFIRPRRRPHTVLLPYTNALPISRVRPTQDVAPGVPEGSRRLQLEGIGQIGSQGLACVVFRHIEPTVHVAQDLRSPDRKSTRLNSSHVAISYAVFCLKK